MTSRRSRYTPVSEAFTAAENCSRTALSDALLSLRNQSQRLAQQILGQGARTQRPLREASNRAFAKRAISSASAGAGFAPRPRCSLADARN